LFALFFVTASVYSQELSKLDSLINTLSQKEDTAKTTVFYNITKYLIVSDVDSAKYYAEKGLKYALDNDQDYYIGRFHSALGDIYVVKNDFYSAMDNYMKALRFYKNVDYYEGQSLVYLVIGNIYLSQGNFYTALENYQKGLAIADSINFQRPLPHIYNNIGELNLALDDYDHAIENYKKAFEINKKNNDDLGTASSLINIGKVYIVKGEVDTALDYLDKAYNIYDKNSDNLGLQRIFSTKGEIEKIKGNYKTALKYFFKALGYIDKLGGDYFGPKSKLYAENYNDIGYCYIKLKNYDKAKEFLFKAKAIAEETGLLEILVKNTNYLSEMFEMKGDAWAALKYNKLYKAYSDSVAKEQNSERITRLEMQYKFDRLLKQREVEELKYRETQRRKELLYLIIIGGAVALLIVLALLLNNQRLKRNNLALLKDKLTRDLEYKNKELTTNVLYLLKKNEMILNLSNQLKNSRYSFKPENRKIIDGIIHDMEQSTSKDVWKEFELRFQEVHSDFYKKLTEKHPDLSPNELRLSAFLRLNMSTKEISSITFQSYNSIIMARHRLRKKLGISSNENLITFLRQL
jgi:tetratricopeptide (TPR) repeat protein